MSESVPSCADVLTVADGWLQPLTVLLSGFSIEVRSVSVDAPIPCSYWGEPEAGLEGMTVWVRADTPVHSVLHEASHVMCMQEARRAQLKMDAGGDFDEENAVCYLQITLADQIPQLGSQRLMLDMDRWGYTFRLGSTQAWFREEGAEANAWLQRHGVLDQQGHLTGRLRA
jgi:hypothetical protein